MANLFAVVLTFGRLSADGEWAALLAAGYSLRRAAVPTLVTAVVLYGIAASAALNLEAWGRRELVQFFYRKTQTELDNLIKYKLQSGVFLDDFLGYVLYAEKISSDRSKFENVMLAPGPDNHRDNFTILAPSGNLTGSVETGNLRLSLDFGVGYSSQPGSDKISVFKFNRADIDLLRIFREQIIGADSAGDDYRSYPPGELWKYVETLRSLPKRSDEQQNSYLRARYLLHSRIASPFAVVAFALFGMVLGVTDPRRGKSFAYIGAILTIIFGYVLLMSFKWLAENDLLSAPLAGWMPNILLTAFGAFLVYQKNRLPPSEGTLDPDNLPLIGWLRRSRQRGGAARAP